MTSPEAERTPTPDPRPRVWITRAEPGAWRTAARLAEAGYDALVAPLIETRSRPFDPATLPAHDALAFTSAAGVAAFADALGARGPGPLVFTVGDATAEAARVAGFAVVRSAAGDGSALARLILEALPPGSSVLHPGALRPAFDLAGALRAGGLLAELLPVYETVALREFPSAAAAALAEGAVAAVLVHSPAAARALAGLMPSGIGDVAVAALSPACAAPLRSLARRIVTAASPDEPALFAALASVRLHAAPSPAPTELGKPPERR